jgi:tetratricopeptide (TPR) repeat protein
MTGQLTKDRVTHKYPHSKAFKAGLGTLAEEIELALQWNRPSILFAVHNSKTGRIDAQKSLESEILKRNRRAEYITIESANPDVIRVMSETPHSERLVFFVSGIENADQVSNGKVYHALNIRRELLVERGIRAVFWLNESEAASLARFAPDFWAFRHRVVEFAPKRGSKKQTIPTGLFLWEEQIPWMEEDALENKLAYYEKSLTLLPKAEGAIAARIETILKLAHYSWLLNNHKKMVGYVKDSIDLLEKYPIPRNQAWALNAKGIGFYEEGNKLDASAQFTQALIHDPGNSTIMMNAGIASHGLGKNGNAILTGRRAIKIDKGNFQLWRALGYLFLSMGKIEDAIEVITKAKDLNPYDLDPHYSLAVCFYKNGQSVECEKELIIAGKISPPQNTIQRACVDILGGKTDEALAYLNCSLEKREIERHHIQRDPNLYSLLDSQDFMVFN